MQRAARCGAEHYRIVAIVKRLDTNEGVGMFSARVIAGELAEGAFILDVSFRNKTLDGDFGIGGNWQARDRPADHWHALSRQSRQSR